MSLERADFIGDWDLYSGPMHSELQLDGSGSYIHSLWQTVRRHWGTWSLEPQEGATFLVLHLQDAYPRIEAGPFGIQPLLWPAVEAWPILEANPQSVIFYNARMFKRMNVPSNVPAYVPAAMGPLGPPASMPPEASAGFPVPTSNTAESQTFSTPMVSAPPAPSIFPGSGAGNSPPAPPILDQWQQEHAQWNEVRKVVADTLKDDLDTNRQISNMYAGQNQVALASQFANTQAMSDLIHSSTQRFIATVLKSR